MRGIVTGLQEMSLPGSLQKELRELKKATGANNVSNSFTKLEYPLNIDAVVITVGFNPSAWTGRA